MLVAAGEVASGGGRGKEVDGQLGGVVTVDLALVGWINGSWMDGGWMNGDWMVEDEWGLDGGGWMVGRRC